MLIKSVICVFGLSMGVACGNSPGDDVPPPFSGETANLVAAVTLASGATVEFYEPAPGVLWVSQSGTDGQKPMEPGRDEEQLESVVDFYRRIRPGSPMPAELAAAYERSIALAHSTPSPALRGTRPSPAVGGGRPELSTLPSSSEARSTSQRLTAAEFSVGKFQGGYAFCPTSSDYGAWNWCLLDWWGGAWASDGATDRAWATVSAEEGDVTFKVSTEDYGGGAWTVPQGSWRWWKSGWTRCGFTNYCDFSARFAVENAENSRFHFGGAFTHVD